MGFESIYKKLFRYRRWIAGCFAGSLVFNKGLVVFFPETLFMPSNAELNVGNFSFEHAAWLVRSTRQDIALNDVVFPFISKHSSCHCAGITGWSKVTEIPVVGIPKFYFCSNVYEVEALEIKLNESEKVVDSAGGPNELAFLESLIFSNAAQKFDIARQLYILSSNWPLAHILISPIFVMIGYLVCFPGLQLLFSPGKPVSLLRILQWQIVGVVITWILHKLAKNFLNYMMIKSIDHKTASISKEYASGALEFCENTRKTNKALRILLGKNGERLYSSYGDWSTKFFNPEPPLLEREKYFKTIFKKFD